MSAVVEDLVRLAGQAHAGGRPGMRDALLTLAVTEGGAEDAVLSERCRRLLVKHRPDHWFAASTTVGLALARPQVSSAMRKLRLMYPPVRVRHLLLRGDAARGPYAGWTLPVARVLEDLTPIHVGPPVAASSGSVRRRDPAAARALPFPRAGESPVAAGAGPLDPDGSVAIFYLSVLLAIAVLLNSVLRPAETETRAA